MFKQLQNSKHLCYRLFNFNKTTLSMCTVDDEKLSKREYWKEKYESNGNEHFDWFIESGFSDLLTQSCAEILYGLGLQIDKKHLNILEVGCGTSAFAKELYCKLKIPVNIVCVDFVHKALDFQSRILSQSVPACDDSSFAVVCADICCLPFTKETFHIVFDKGTMDALMKNKLKGKENSRKMLSEVQRVLQTNGRMFQVTDEDPESRVLLLENLSTATNKFTPKESHFHNSLFSSRPKWYFERILTDQEQEYFLYWFSKH